MGRKSRMLIAVLASLAALISARNAEACTLNGYVLHAYLDVTTGTGHIYVVDSSGSLMGGALLPNVGTNGAMTAAWETFRDVIASVPSYNSTANAILAYFVKQPRVVGHPVVVYTDSLLGCGSYDSNTLQSFYVRY